MVDFEYVGIRGIEVKILDTSGKWYQCVVQDGISLTRQINTAAKLTCSIRRDEITAQKNDQIILYVDGQVIFWGLIIDTEKITDWCSVVAYDQMWYLSRNKGWMQYEGIPAEDVLFAAMSENSLHTTKEWVGTGYPLPARVENNVSYLDMVQTAIDTTEENTGKHFFFYDDCNNMKFVSANEMIITDFRISSSYLESYKINESLSDTSTEVLVSFQAPNQEEGKTENLDQTARAVNERQFERFGKLTYTDSADSGENAQAKADSLIVQVSEEPVKMTFTGVQASPRFRGGTRVWVDFYTFDNFEFIRGWFQVDSVTFNIKDAYFTMDLETTLLWPYNEWDDRTGFIPYVPYE